MRFDPSLPQSYPQLLGITGISSISKDLRTNTYNAYQGWRPTLAFYKEEIGTTFKPA